MLLKKPQENKRHSQERNFLLRELQFTEHQKDKFLSFDAVHRENMMHFDQQIRRQKKVMFNSFSEGLTSIDALSILIGELTRKKEVEVFRFFKSVRKICTKEQQTKFDKIISKALKSGKNGPPKGRRKLPPKDRK